MIYYVYIKKQFPPKIKNVRDHRTEDRMESFFLAETTKYLYLLFDPDNPLNSNGGSGTIIDTPRGQCLIEAGGYIFNTEAHPVDTSALRCCHDEMRHPLAGYEPDRLGDRFEWSLREEEIAKEDAAVVEERIRKDEEIRNRITSTVIDVGSAKVDTTEETRNKIVAEILSVLKENKFNQENAKFPADVNESSNISQPTDDIILTVPAEDTAVNGGDEEASTGVGEVVAVDSTENDILTNNDPPVAVVTLPPTRDLDDHKTTKQPHEFVAFDEENATTTPAPLPQLANPTTSDVFAKNTNHDQASDLQQPGDQLLANISAKQNETNITDFVHSILKSALPAAPRFDAQKLLEKVRSNEAQRLLLDGRNSSHVDYRWLTCRAQPFLHRISVMGEFFY